MASLTLITPTRSKLTPPTTTISATAPPGRCQFITLFATVLLFSATAATPAFAASNEGYIKETEEVINKIRNTINIAKMDPKVADVVAESILYIKVG
ncbi:hypothetical protein LguiA_014547 [Lonicera macranthoides]